MQVRTYQDAVDYLHDVFSVDKTPKFVRLVRRAIDEAYRDLPYRAAWTYYRRREIINTVAPQSSGTISYANSTRIVTLTGSTFPTNAQSYRIIIGNSAYDVEKYLTSTTLLLPDNQNPGTDVASGTTYNLHRAGYSLPDNFRRMLGIYDPNQQRELISIEDAREQGVRVAVYSNPDTPWWYSIRSTGSYLGTTEILFVPAPALATSYDVMYLAGPRPIGIFEKYSVGTVSATANSATVTGTGTVFPLNCEGTVIRFSSNSSDEPTGPFGALINNVNVDNPYAEQNVILTRVSDTEVTLQSAAVNSLSDVKYTISDPIDIEMGSMLTAFLLLAEAKFSRLVGRDAKDRVERDAAFVQALIRAKEDDNKKPWTRGQVQYDPTLRLQVLPQI